jgi:hypothetical protein
VIEEGDSATVEVGAARTAWLPRSAIVLFAAIATALVIVAHGCHGGDHDLEPVFLPPTQSPEAAR